MIFNLVPPGEYEQKEKEALRQFQTLLEQGESISIKKNVKHIFKERDKKPNLDLRQFNQVLSIDTDNCLATVEGMTTFYDLVEAALAYGLMPQAVPELRSITVGGAVAGLGGQSSSFKFGLVHEMVTEFDLLSGEGKVIHCAPDSHADLFYMLPNSYGSLGYVLKCKIKLNKVLPFVQVNYQRFAAPGEYFAAMERAVMAGTADFIEGVSFSPREYILLTGKFISAPAPGEKLLVPLYEPFFQTVRNPKIKLRTLSIKDYIWRWDADAFWATDQKNLIGDILLNPLIRRTVGSSILRSDRLVKIGQYRNKIRKKFGANNKLPRSKRKEALIQDAAIPFAVAAEFDAWLARELNIFPLWYCPVRTTQPLGTYPLYQPESVFVLDFGFYISMELEEQMEATYYNRRIERKLLEIGGLKCLYSDTFFSPEQFWSIYDKEQYEQVKAKYDPHNAYLNLYDKVVNKG